MNFLKTLLSFVVLALLAFGCASTEGELGRQGGGFSGRGINVKVEQVPQAVFNGANIKSVAVIKFDAKGVKSFQGVVLDYIELSNVFTDDLIKSFYRRSQGVQVAIGEFEETIIETDELARQRGDQELRISKAGREIVYKATPYKKIDALITGRINVFRKEVPFERSYIHITLKIISTYDGKVYWISDLDGNYRDVIETISLSINNGKLTYPIPEAKKAKEAPEKVEVPKKSKKSKKK